MGFGELFVECHPPLSDASFAFMLSADGDRARVKENRIVSPILEEFVKLS
jgi:hypothetical protein